MLPWGWGWAPGRRMSPACGAGGVGGTVGIGDIPLGGGPVPPGFALGLGLVALQPGWELGATSGARPQPAHPGVLAGWWVSTAGWGRWRWLQLMYPLCISHRAGFSLLIERETEVVMPGGGQYAPAMLPAPALATARLRCGSRAAAPGSSPTSNSSYGKHPQNLGDGFWPRAVAGTHCW